ncbi:MAG: hypothetical protein HC802_17125, partial [Caldilineaceae bacterium]|nr:hypothetical protein [Caldilineaceae bacterium]
MGWVGSEQILLFNAGTLPVAEELDLRAPQAAPASTVVENEEPTAAGMAVAVVEAAAAPTPSPAPVAPASLPADVMATVDLVDARLNMRSGPGTDFPVVAKALPSESFRALARNGAGTWVQLQLPALADDVAWVAGDFISLSAPVTDLLISDRISALPGLVEVTLAPVAERSTSAPVEGLAGNLVFYDGQGAIHRYNLETGVLSRLTGGSDPAVSPDGRQVAFLRSGGEYGLYLIDMDGGNEREIFRSGGRLGSPSWRSDGQAIVFSEADGSFKCYDIGLGLCFTNRELCPGFRCLPASARVEKPEFQLSVVDVNGEGYRNLHALNTAQSPNWGPDGVVYGSSTGLEITQDQPNADDLVGWPLRSFISIQRGSRRASVS